VRDLSRNGETKINNQKEKRLHERCISHIPNSHNIYVFSRDLMDGLDWIGMEGMDAFGRYGWMDCLQSIT
jgi:hypothetical protein